MADLRRGSWLWKSCASVSLYVCLNWPMDATSASCLLLCFMQVARKVCGPDLAVLFPAVNLGAGHEKDKLFWQWEIPSDWHLSHGESRLCIWCVTGVLWAHVHTEWPDCGALLINPLVEPCRDWGAHWFSAMGGTLFCLSQRVQPWSRVFSRVHVL